MDVLAAYAVAGVIQQLALDVLVWAKKQDH